MTPEQIAAKVEVPDVLVWAAYEAAKKEGGRWRLLDFKGHGSVAVNDMRRSYDFAAPIDETESFEKHEFRDAKLAAEYIEWRAMKAALSAVRAIIEKEAAQ